VNAAQGVWLLGVVGCFALLVVGLARLQWLVARARTIDSERWLVIAEELRRSYELSSPIQLVETDRSSLLVTWGCRRPKVMLPATARDWPSDRIRIVLAHELAHVARRDWVFQLAGELLRAVYWFNPLVWIVCRRMRLESECACDDAVLARGVEAPEYAAHLLALARSLVPRRHWLPAPAMARPSSLEGRIRAMLNTTISRRPVSWSGRVSTLAVLVVLTITLAGAQTQPQFHSLTGIVLDPSDRVVPDTRLILTNRTSNAKYEVQADATGRFEFVGLPSAAYAVEARRAGFRTLARDVNVGGNIELALKLEIGTLQEEIVTNGKPPAATADVAARRAEARRRFAEIEQREKARCASGDIASGVGGHVLPPLKLIHAAPVYPDYLRAAGIGGVVTLTAVIGTDGMVKDVDNLQGPHPDLVAAAADAVRQWQFSATLLNCEPTDVEMKVTTIFEPAP
jgi:TonB family protein